ncbi:MAG: SH3 domain-containing protein [Hyphomicrobiaceae bacterium]
MFASLRPQFSCLLGILLLFAVMPATAAEQRLLCVHGVEPSDQLNVRSAPGFNAPVVARFPANACGVQLVGRCTDGWCEMALNGAAGWVYTKHIAVYDVPNGHPSTAKQAIRPEIVEQGSGDPTLCVARVSRGDTLRLRTGPGVSHDEIGGIPPGACGVERIGACKGPWCQIAWRGRTGWVNTYYLD